MPTNVLQFGDGYAQRTPDGLNRASEVWNVECVYNNRSEDDALQGFLNTVGGWQPFLWQSPRDTQAQTYVIVMPVSSSIRSGSEAKPLFYSRSLKFKRVYDLSVALPPLQYTAITYLSPQQIEIGPSTTYL